MNLSTLVMQIKREYWEHRRLFLLIPLCAVLLISGLEIWGVIAGIQHLPGMEGVDVVRAQGSQDFQKPGMMALVIELQQFGNWMIFVSIVTAIALVYCLSALYQDRKSREVLFWRAMPVSESTSVMTKLFMAACSIPLIAFLMSLVSTLLSILALGLWWGSLDQLGVALGNLSDLSHYLWGGLLAVPLVLPLLVWTLFVSAAASKNPLLFAWVVPLLLLLVDRLLFHYAGLNLYWFDLAVGYLDYITVVLMLAVKPAAMNIPIARDLMLVPLVTMMALVVALLAATIWLRKNRYEI